MPRSLKILLIVLAAFSLLYAVYWFAAAYVIERQIKTEIAKQQRADRSLTLGKIDVSVCNTAVLLLYGNDERTCRSVGVAVFPRIFSAWSAWQAKTT